MPRIQNILLHTVFLVTLLSGSATCLKAQEASVISTIENRDADAQLDQAKKTVLNGAYQEAHELYERIFRQSSASGSYYHAAKSQVGIGNIEIYRGDYRGALERYTNALKLCDTGIATKLRTTLLNNIGNIYILRGDFINSSKYYGMALAAAERYGSELPMETLYNNLSITHNRLHDPEKALVYLDKAEKLALSNNNFYTLADIYNNKGLSFSEQKKYAESIQAYQQSIHLSKDYGYINTLYSAYTNLGIILLNQNDLDAALHQFSLAQQIGKDVSSYQKNMLMVALSAVHVKRKDLKKAIPMLHATLALAGELGNLKDQITAHQLLAEVFRQQRIFDSAFFHKDKESQLADSFRRSDIAHAVAEIENKYNAALKDKEIAEKKLTIAKQSTHIASITKWATMISFFAAFVLLFAIYQRKRFLHKQSLKDQELRSVRQQQKLNEMNALIEGEEKERIRLSHEIHDSIMVQFSVIKMGLSTWMGDSKKLLSPEDVRPLMHQLDEATENLRRTVHNLMPDMLLEDGLIETLYYFCANVQKMVPIRIVFQPIGAIQKFDTRFELNIYRIIQELIQNTIKHAKASELIVQVSYRTGLLSITVEDNGIGMDISKNYRGTGLKSITARIASLAGTIDIDSVPGIGTTVHLAFDINKVETLAQDHH